MQGRVEHFGEMSQGQHYVTVCHSLGLGLWTWKAAGQAYFSPFHTEQRADAGQLQMYVVTKPDPCWLTRMWHVRWSVTRITKIAPQKTKGFMCGTVSFEAHMPFILSPCAHTSKSQSCFIPFTNSLRTQPSNIPRRWQDEKKKQQFIVDSKLEGRKVTLPLTPTHPKHVLQTI